MAAGKAGEAASFQSNRNSGCVQAELREEPAMMAYHRTAAGQEIMRSGFHDSVDSYMTTRLHRGVWVSDVPLDVNEGASGDDLIVVDVPDELFARYEWIEDGKPYREALVPARLLNLCPRRLTETGATAAAHAVEVVLSIANGLWDAEFLPDGEARCRGKNGIGIDSAVTVKDGSGAIVGLGRITAFEIKAPTPQDVSSCILSGTVADVPETPFYSVEVGNSGAVNFSLDDMKANYWTVILEIGGG